MEEYKFVVIGGRGVGKTCIVIQLVCHLFLKELDPTIEDSYRHQCTIDEDPCVLDILDTAGGSEFIAMRDQYMRRGHGFVLIYSVTSRHSFDMLYMMRDQILRAKGDNPTNIIVIGNKCDLVKERQVSTEEGEEIAQIFNCTFYESSSKDRINIDEAFYTLVREIREATLQNQYHRK